jgi:AraC-like DNA-binding protein
MFVEKELLYRPTASPAAEVPLGARSVGHYRVEPGYRDNVAVKHFVQVFWGVSGYGALVLNGMERTLHPGQVAVYFPGMEHRVYALDVEWEYRWWTMDGSLASACTTAFGLASDIFDVGPAPVKEFKSLAKAIGDIGEAGEIAASALAYRLLALASSRKKPETADPLIQQAREIMQREWGNPALGVEALAYRLRLHRSSFTRRFAEIVGLAPVEYISNLRVQNALSLLKQTDRPVAEIARSCGYTDPNYFSRMIRKATGLSPRQFRERI